jgi:hypothetical protein
MHLTIEFSWIVLHLWVWDGVTLFVIFYCFETSQEVPLLLSISFMNIQVLDEVLPQGKDR